MSTYLLIPSSTFVTTTLVVIFIILASVSDACFIRNCPKGGKRSLETAMAPIRQCPRCGDGGLGQCVGPNVCCGPHLGCHIGTVEAEVCQQESASPSPCAVTGEACGVNYKGNCVADGICCDYESCAMNDKCKPRKETTPAYLRSLIKLIHMKEYA